MADYSDAVEDEWLVVHILRELTRSHPSLWVRVFDTDGEFLLVEAANVLPRWLSPEIDHNRVWIHDGNLFIIPVKDEPGLEKRTLSLPDAVEALKSKRAALVHSTSIEAEAFYRLEKYPAQITDSIHHSCVTIPRKVAYLLHSLPKAIAPVVEAFYLRDAISLKRVISPSAPLTFAPDDLVTVSVKFSKVLFAQLRSQRFDMPSAWQPVFQRTQRATSPADAEKALARLEMGMKLTCGFEMLAATAAKSKSRVVRELAVELEDLAEDGEDGLPPDEEIKSWANADRDDSEVWMDINYGDFERELDGKRAQRQPPGSATQGFGDVNTQTDLRKMVSRFEAFLSDDGAGVDGAELHDMDFDDDDDDSDDNESEDKDVSFDEEEFARMMREMMGLPTVETKSPKAPNGKQPAEPEAPRLEPVDKDDDDEEIGQLMSQFEAELNQHGALRLDPPTDKKSRLKAKEAPASGPSKGTTQTHDDDNKEDEEDADEEIDIDFNLAKNLLESFKGQAGAAGPTGNLLGMMGFQLPRDEDDGREEEEDAGPSRQSRR